MASDELQLVSQVLLEDIEFNDELETWCKSKCSVFDDSTEHKLEYTVLHEEFCSMFESKVTKVLEAKNYEVDVFWQKLTKAADEKDMSIYGDSFLLECLVAVIDYDQFHTTMCSLKREKSGK